MHVPHNPEPSIRLERRLLAMGYNVIAGVDEVGRGSWAGPLVAAAVVLPIRRWSLMRRLSAVRDSKALTHAQRIELNTEILDVCLGVGVGWVSHRTVDRDGVAAANRRALNQAVTNLPVQPDALLLDYFSIPDCPLPQTCVTRGDAISLSIAAASIIAKVLRDRWMVQCERHYPRYGFAMHKGYGTRIHREALKSLGACEIHRRSFTPLAPHRQ